MNTDNFIDANDAGGSGWKQAIGRRKAELRGGLSLLALAFTGVLTLNAAPVLADTTIDMHGCPPGKLLWERGTEFGCVWLDFDHAFNLDTQTTFTYLTQNGDPHGVAKVPGSSKDPHNPPKPKPKTPKTTSEKKVEKKVASMCFNPANMKSKDVARRGRPSLSSSGGDENKLYTCLVKMPTDWNDMSKDVWTGTVYDAKGGVLGICSRPTDDLEPAIEYDAGKTGKKWDCLWYTGHPPKPIFDF
jgi:hypothetical protein